MVKRIAILSLLCWCACAPVLAQRISPVTARDVRQTPDGVDRVFSFTVVNALPRDFVVHGRVTVINVYDTSLPVTLPFDGLTVPAGGTAPVQVRWHDAPLAGQVRALIVVSDGLDPSYVAPMTFWLWPSLPNVGIVALGILFTLGVVLVWRLLRKRTKRPKVSAPAARRIPTNMLPYVVEPNDSLMSLTSRFDVSWEDLVRANRMMPPYELRPGKTILIPRHPLKSKPAPKA